MQSTSTLRVKFSWTTPSIYDCVVLGQYSNQVHNSRNDIGLVRWSATNGNQQVIGSHALFLALPLFLLMPLSASTISVRVMFTFMSLVTVG